MMVHILSNDDFRNEPSPYKRLGAGDRNDARLSSKSCERVVDELGDTEVPLRTSRLR
jgi:hypothetical protein